ncbi:hypothetical protein PRIPAC_88311 [Pristionchus pacificus]|uniref:Uncharacterized protein n=1 Tax=Pristionchus pacificus TaxID=54126 RepID=A0A2A6CCW5_PRIPA|nr:hypothetical protein PRIPAC_88311 [Pristionchus pacificus]|eukprot:PDM75883.1 hypothetical protein PRIPAC_38514 [Pristionchus pacificus]
MGDPLSSSSFLRRTLPPYYKYAVFLLCGFDLVFSCFVLAISEAYYKSAKTVLPIAYGMFNDTITKGKDNFTWDQSMQDSLELYKYKMMVLWVCCTVCVLFSMILIIPQFFDFNDARGNPSHLCLVRRRLGWILFTIQLIIDLILGAAIVWAWIGCAETVAMFHKLFSESEAEEAFVSKLEKELECWTDDDKEVKTHQVCWNMVKMSVIRGWWMDAILITFFIGHLIVLLLTPLFNRQLVKPDEDDDIYKEDLLHE